MVYPEPNELLDFFKSAVFQKELTLQGNFKQAIAEFYNRFGQTGNNQVTSPFQSELFHDAGLHLYKFVNKQPYFYFEVFLLDDPGAKLHFELSSEANADVFSSRSNYKAFLKEQADKCRAILNT